MLSLEQKRQVFFAMRTENYLASLRLEGLSPGISDLPPDLTLTTGEALVAEAATSPQTATVFAEQA